MTARTYRRVMPILLTVCLLLCTGLSGCALFSGLRGDKNDEPIADQFDEVEEPRSEGDKMSDYAASAGRANPNEKKKVDPGQTFLLSSKAKEIYQNTER